MERYVQISKYLSLILRHKPHVIDITLDKNGWADVDKLIAGVSKKYEFNMEILEDIVATDSKGRYIFNADKTKIRASQGHSVSVDVELNEWIPRSVLFHGTGIKSVEKIEIEGLRKMSRLYVHMTNDFEMAVNTGMRHGTPVVYEINTARMHLDGYKFYVSANGVYLTEEVPAKYLTRVFGGGV